MFLSNVIQGNSNYDNALIERFVGDTQVLFGKCPDHSVELQIVGNSRLGREIYAYILGSGSHRVSITAGAHADEPVGPITATLLPLLLGNAFPALLKHFTFYVIPNVNPDGTQQNLAWCDTSAPVYDFKQYFRYRVRELPGDDVEYNYGDSLASRPENQAAMNFFHSYAPYCAHFSLHGMALAEGAWFLICQDWVKRATSLMQQLSRLCETLAFPLHDMERRGEKGFHRIQSGFCTTPTSTAMREFFLARNEPDIASRFLPSSMEYIASLGGDPLCMVSEIPLFQLRASEDPIQQSNFQSCLEDLRSFQQDASDDALDRLVDRFDIKAVPKLSHIRLQFGMIVLALESLAKSWNTA